MPVKLTPLLIHRAPMIKNSGLDPIAAANLAPVSAQNPAQTAAGSALRKNLEKVTQAPRSGAAAPVNEDGGRATTAVICAPIVRQEGDSPFIDPNFRDFICRLDSVQQVQVIEDKQKEMGGNGNAGLIFITCYASWLKPAAFGFFIALLRSDSNGYQSALTILVCDLPQLTNEQQALTAVKAVNSGDRAVVSILIERGGSCPGLQDLVIRCLPKVHDSLSANDVKILIESVQKNYVVPNGNWKNKVLAVLAPQDMAPASAQTPAQPAADSVLTKNPEEVTQATQSEATAPVNKDGGRATTAAICAPIVRQVLNNLPFVDPNFRNFIAGLDSAQQVQVIEDKEKEMGGNNNDGLFFIARQARWLKPAAFGFFIALLRNDSDAYHNSLTQLVLDFFQLTNKQQALTALKVVNSGHEGIVSLLITIASEYPAVQDLVIRYLPKVYDSLCANDVQTLIKSVQENCVVPNGNWKNKVLAVLAPQDTRTNLALRP